MDAFSTNCDTSIPAYHHSGTRPLSAIRLIVMHSTESPNRAGSAKAVANYFASPSSGGSTHLIVDDASCYRPLRNEQVGWSAPGANTDGFHIEQCGYASWTPQEWGSHMQTLRRGAYKAAFHCRKFGIPAVWVDHIGILAGKKGITTHAEVTKAYPQGSHTDPGSGWPRALFIALVKGYL